MLPKLNFRQRLINVLTVAAMPFTAMLLHEVYLMVLEHLAGSRIDIVEAYAIAALSAAPYIITAGFSFLLGTGFKAWHK